MFIIVIFTDKSLLLILLFVVVKIIWFWNILAGICQCWFVLVLLSLLFYSYVADLLPFETFFVWIFLICLQFLALVVFYKGNIYVFMYLSVVSLLLTFLFIWFQNILYMDMNVCIEINATFNVVYQLSSYIFFYQSYKNKIECSFI